MTYVHVNPGKDNWGEAAPAYLAKIGYVLSDILGRASVPALSILGGYLALSAYRRRADWWAYIKDRAQTLLTPLVTWNAIIILLSILILTFSGAYTSIMRELMPFDKVSFFLILDRLTGYNYGAATQALNFLRDIFVCSALFPLLVLLLKRTGLLGLGAIWLVGLLIGFYPIIMRPNILLFFTIGVYLSLHSERITPSREIATRVLTTVLLTLAITYLLPNSLTQQAQNVPNTLLRLFVATGFLTSAILLSKTSLGNLIAKAEPVAYLLFLSHATVITLLWGIWQKFFGNDLSLPYLFFYIFAPMVNLLVLLASYKFLAKLPTALQIMLNGKIVKN